MPITTRYSNTTIDSSFNFNTGPVGPFPDIKLQKVLERRWLHYAFLTRDNEMGMVANVALLGPGLDNKGAGKRSTSIVLVHKRNEGWLSSQFNAETLMPLWSSFEQPHAYHKKGLFELASTTGTPSVKLKLMRSSRPCTSQCAYFEPDNFLRWQSETGVIAQGDWKFGDKLFKSIDAVGYHERVRGYWGWPELGGWVFGFANDPAVTDDVAPPAAFVFTLLQPCAPKDASTASVMVWRNGRLCRHFPRRCVSFAVRGNLQRDKVCQVPELSNILGVPPAMPIPDHLMISAKMGDDWVVYDFQCESAARVVIPGETCINPFSVHEVIGDVCVEGSINGKAFSFETRGIVEFAGGAGGD